MQRKIQIDGRNLQDWTTFHDEFARIFGFPEFYGRNMDAWIDCMSSLDAPEDGLTSVHVRSGEVIVLCVSDMEDVRQRCSEVYDALLEAVAFVNWRRIEVGEPAILALAYG
ncbi:MAG TPA: barstar family protein [Verrucomicrobiae bacterium]